MTDKRPTKHVNYSNENEDERIVILQKNALIKIFLTKFMKFQKLRSSNYIQRRKSIHEDSPEPSTLNVKNSPLQKRKKFTPDREYSKSPSKLYPDLEKELPTEEHDISSSQESSFNNSQKAENAEPSKSLWIIVLVVLAGMLLYFLTSSGSKADVTDSHLINCSDLLELAKKFPNQDQKIFKSLKTATEGLFNRNGRIPVVSFFSTNQHTLDAVIKTIVETTKKCINQTYDPINLTTAKLNQEKFLKDHTKIITEYKEELKKRTIMVVNNLESLSVNVLPSFHSIADTYNPLVRKSIIYLTFKVPEEPTGSHFDYIYNFLSNQWHEMANNIKNPLITRLLDQTFYINPSK